MRKKLYRSLIVVIVLTCQAVPAWCGEQGDLVSLRAYMDKLANEQDCYYTVETGRPLTKDPAFEPLMGTMVQWPREPLDVESHLKYLAAHIENFAWVGNASSPLVIHIADARILKLKEYPLEKGLTDFWSKGTIGDLMDGLVKREPRLGICRGGPGIMDWGMDLRSKLPIPFQKQIGVRDALTVFLHLGRYCQMLCMKISASGSSSQAA